MFAQGAVDYSRHVVLCFGPVLPKGNGQGLTRLAPYENLRARPRLVCLIEVCHKSGGSGDSPTSALSFARSVSDLAFSVRELRVPHASSPTGELRA